MRPSSRVTIRLPQTGQRGELELPTIRSVSVVILTVVRLAILCLPCGSAREWSQHDGTALSKSLVMGWEVLGFSCNTEIDLK
jgi:hypothetical protein